MITRNTLETELTLDNVEIEYDYSSGFEGSHTEPPEPPSAKILKVMRNGMDITGCLDPDCIEWLEGTIIKEHKHEN